MEQLKFISKLLITIVLTFGITATALSAPPKDGLTEADRKYKPRFRNTSE